MIGVSRECKNFASDSHKITIPEPYLYERMRRLVAVETIGLGHGGISEVS